MSPENTHALFGGRRFYASGGIKDLLMVAPLDDIKDYVEENDWGSDWWQIVELSTMTLVDQSEDVAHT